MDFAVLKKIPSSRHYENVEFRTIVDKSLGMEITESKPIFCASPAFSRKESVRINFSRSEDSTDYHSDGAILPMRTLPRPKPHIPVGKYYYYEEQGHVLKPKCNVRALPREGRPPSAFHRFPRGFCARVSPPPCSACREREQRRFAHAATQTEPKKPTKESVLKKVFHWPLKRREDGQRKEKGNRAEQRE